MFLPTEWTELQIFHQFSPVSLRLIIKTRLCINRETNAHKLFDVKCL